MTTQKLKVLVNTVIKQLTIDSTQLADSQKYPLAKGAVIAIDSYVCAPDDHWQLQLTTPINGVKSWFAYRPHVSVIGHQTTEKILEDIKNNTHFNVYHQPTDQDGDGMPPNGNKNRSEQYCPVYVLSPRRQTDSLVRQLIKLLPTNNDTAFIIAERLIQFPEEYLKTISNFKKAVLVQSFVGLGDPSEKEKDPDPTDYPDEAKQNYPDEAKQRHDKELYCIEQSIRLLQSMSLEITTVLCAMGDSQKESSKNVRETMQKRLYDLLDQYNLSALKQPVTWGADELIAMGMAQTLPQTKVSIKISNPEAAMWYDGLRPARELVTEKLQSVGLLESENGWDFEVLILTRRERSKCEKTDDYYDYQTNDLQQKILDREFLEAYQNYSSEQRQKLVVIDSRLFNGVWDKDSVLPYSDLLAFGSWGTFGNCVGSTLAVAKILFHAKNKAAQKQLYLEAVAHDVFANGYAEAQRNGFKDNLKDDAGINFHHDGYWEDNEKIAIANVKKVFKVLNQHVNQRMQEHFEGNPDIKNRIFRLTPQFWRTFESEVHIWPRLPDEVHEIGIYRTDLARNAIAFNPSSNGQSA